MVAPPETVAVRTVVNGRSHDLTVAPQSLLIDVLRDEMGLTGTKLGCAIGICGACSVLLDGELVSACLILAVAVHERAVTTIEGIAGADGTLSAVQHQFMVHGGFQCGICTPGQVIAATALLAESSSPDERTVREWMCGNLCRCTGYEGIVDSILAAAASASSDPPA